MIRIVRGLSLICVVLVVVLHQVPENTTEAQTIEIDVCEDADYVPCSVEWSPIGGSGLLIRAVYRISLTDADS